MRNNHSLICARVSL